MTEKRFQGDAQWTVRVRGLQYIFKALILIAEILLYTITVPNGVCDKEWRDNLKERLEDLK